MKAILLPLLFVNLLSFAQTPIADVQGQQAASPYVDQTVTIKGIVTAASASAPGYFVQDGEGAWSGIYIYEPNRSPKPEIGDELLLTGVVSEYYDFTEISDLTSYEILSSGNLLPEAISIDAITDLEPYEGVLVKVSNASCTQVSLGYGEWEVNAGSGPIVINDFFYAFTPVLGISYDIAGPLEYSYSAYKIDPRSADDVVTNAPVYFTKNPYQLNLSKTAITLAWETNSASTTELKYGKTENLELGELKLDELHTEHQITIENLDAGELYFVQAFSVLESDSSPIELQSFTTISNSSGEIRVAFTSPGYLMLTGGNGGQTEMHQFGTPAIADTIVAYINKAKQSLDIAIYDVVNHAPQSDATNLKIFDAIKAQAEAGIKVRLITDDTSTDPFFTELMENAQVMWGNTDAIMHHKFIVVDAESELGSWVVSGSTNWTYNNLVMDANNLIALQDRSLAKAYTAEFNEMWGGPQDEPNYTTGRYSGQKKNNTPHLFEIGGKNVELYFSPSDKTESKIIEAIHKADHEIIFSMMAFTSDGIAAALIDAHSRGVDVTGVIDYIEYSGTEYEPLLAAGIEVRDYTNPDGGSWPDNITIHHKFMVCDYKHPESDPTVVTGTHNWSASAESRNDENTLFIHDAELAGIYASEAEHIYYVSDQGNAVRIVNNEFLLFPNPALDQLTVSSKTKISSYSIFNSKGQSVLSEKTENKTNFHINVSSLAKGLHLLNIHTEQGQSLTARFIKQ